MSRRTCAATKPLARSASGDFPPGLRVFRFRSTLCAPRVLGRRARGCGWGSWEGGSGAFLEPSVVGLSPPSSGPVWTVSALVVPPFAARGYPCTARTLRGHGNTPSYSPNTLRRQLRSCALLSLYCIGPGLCPLRHLVSHVDLPPLLTFNPPEDVVGIHDQVFFSLNLYLRTGIFGQDHHVPCAHLYLVGGSHRDNLSRLRLLPGRVRQHYPASRLPLA